MSEELQWVIGVLIAVVTMIGGIIARDRFVMRLMNSEDEATRKAFRDETDKLHERVNRVRDEYVRRTDLDKHIDRLDDSVKELSKEMRNNSAATNQRLDAVLAHLVNARDDK